MGESGSGKSVTAMTLMRLILDQNAVFSGEVLFDGRDLMQLSQRDMLQVRGTRIAMIFQDPMTSLNPVYRVGWQIEEQLRAHEDLSAKQARKRTLELLGAVGIPNPQARVDDYPHQFSGGMRQRVMIAMGISCNPDVLIADEPTTALDVTIQAQILELIGNLQREFDSAVVLITHDLGVVAEVANRVAVMYAGRIVEYARGTRAVPRPAAPLHLGAAGIDLPDGPTPTEAAGRHHGPAAVADLAAGRLQLPAPLPACIRPLPRRAARPGGPVRRRPPGRLPPAGRRQVGAASRGAGGVVSDPGAQPLLRARGIRKYFPIKRGVVFQREVARVHAVDDVDLDLMPGETVGLVGESGCGKSTFGRCLIRLHDLTDGTIEFDGQDISTLDRKQMRPLRREIQMVFQDPYASLNPRKRVGTIIGDPLRIHGVGARGDINKRVQELLELVGLSPEHFNRYPHEFSGGQRQRIGVARALALSPRLIIADEPVSALDVSIQAQVVNLLSDLQDDLGLTYLFIAHDLSVVRHVSDRIAVMYLGKLVELSPAEELYDRPIHPYSEALLSAVPVPDPDVERERIVLQGDVPSPITPPSGCRFHPRCRYATDICTTTEPPLVKHGEHHLAACHHPLNLHS